MSVLTVDGAIALNSAYRDFADRLLAQADALVASNDIKPAEREVVFKQFLVIQQAGMHIVDDASHNVLIGLAPDIKAIQDATKKLNDVADKIAQVTKIVDVALVVATAVGAVAVAIASPNPGSILAAGSALGSAVQKIISST